MNGGMICLPVVAGSNREALARMAEASAEPADLHELRLDLIRERPDVETLVAASTRPVIATCRSEGQGGGFRDGPAERLAILERAVLAGAAFVDAEEDVVCGLKRREGTRIVASWHDFAGTPADLSERVGRLAALPGDWIKFAVTPADQDDNLRVFDAVAASPKPAIGIAMGEVGLPSRVLGPAHGSMVTFGSLSRGLESAPGQPTAAELAGLYRVRELTRNSAVYGLLGDPVAQSSGYVCHNRAFALTGIDAVYIPFLSRNPALFRDVIPGKLPLRGLSVTLPHKVAALELASACSESARLAGAANTLCRRDGRWFADNTDFSAVVETVREKAVRLALALAGAPVLVLGSGGAARGIGAAFASLGARVTLAGRNAARTAELAGKMGWETADWGETGGGWLAVANATSVGMVPNVGETPFPAEGWRPGMIAFDAVYNPRRTRFLREAERAGAATVDGMEMFVSQARGQFALWTGKKMPMECFGPDSAGGL